MDHQQLLAKILEKTYTKQDLSRRIRILKLYLLRQFFGSQDSPDVISDIQSEEEWLDSLGKDTLSKFNRINISATFDKLEKESKEITPIVVYLPFEPSRYAIERIGGHVKSLYGANFIIDIKYDPNLIAGCALVWKGRYKDYSLKSKIDEKKEIVTETIRKSLNV